MEIIGLLLKYSLLFLYLYLSLKKRNMLIPVFLFVMCAIPYSHSLNEFLGLYFNFKIFKLSIQEVLFIILFLRSMFTIFRGNIVVPFRLNNYIIFNIFINITIFIYLIVGLNNNNRNFVINDFKRVMFYLFTLLFILIYSNYKNNFNNINNSIIWGIALYCVIVIVIFIFRNTIFWNLYNKTQWVNSDRLGYANILFSFYILYNKEYYIKYMKNIYKIIFMLMLITTLISKSITFIIAFILVIIIVYGNQFIDKIRGKKLYRRNVYIKISIVLFLISLLLFIMYINLDIEFINKIKNIDIIQKIIKYSNGTLNSMQSRNITNQNALNDFKNNIYGYGLGKTFITFIQNGDIAQLNSIYCDNFFVTSLNKFGAIGSAIFILSIVLQGIMISLRLNNKNTIRFSVCYFSVFFMGLTTSYLISNPIGIVFIQILSINAILDYKNKNFI